MSADNVSICPKCGDGELREWWELCSDAEARHEYEAKPKYIEVDYQCDCRSCGYRDAFSHMHPYRTHPA